MKLMLKSLTLLTLSSIVLLFLFDAAYATSLIWAKRADMPTSRSFLGVATAPGGGIYAVGGQGPLGQPITTVEAYDPVTNSWTSKSPMPTQREGLGVATATNGKIYAIGGHNGSIFTATVEEYDPNTDTWTSKTNMPTERNNLAVAAASNGKIYAIGGFNPGSGYLSTVEEYDPTTDTWITRASLPIGRYLLGAAATSNGKIYAIGGYNGALLDTVEEYDPSTNTWTSKTNMPTERYALGVVRGPNDKIYAIGGTDTQGGQLATVEEYDPVTDTWSTTDPMPTARARLAATLSNNKLYAIGGDENIILGRQPANEEATIVGLNQLTSLGPAPVWIGSKNNHDASVRFDLLAEVYKNGTQLIGSGELNRVKVKGRSSSFKNAKLNFIPLSLSNPVDLPTGSSLSIKLYARNTCSGNRRHSGTARLWYNDSSANSHFDATINSISNSYYLLTGFQLGTSLGSGPKLTIDVDAGSSCSAFKPFGSWEKTF